MHADRSQSLDLPAVSTFSKDLALLFKARLTSLVVFSSVLGALMPMNDIQWGTLGILVISGVLVTGASNALNQVIEREHDAVMSRTCDRPVATGRFSPLLAISMAIIAGSGGILMLWTLFNPYAGILGLMALISYAFIYTPLKRRTPWAVLVGAFPGAIPPMLGWVAVSGEFGPGPGSLFAVQFIWQFPHFWTIAWVADKDYKKAGFRLLPTQDGPGSSDAYLILIHSLFLIPAGLIPWAFGIAGPGSAIFAVLLGAVCTLPVFKLLRTCEMKDAKRAMFASLAYLPLVQLAYVIDKI